MIAIDSSSSTGSMPLMHIKLSNATLLGILFN